MPYIGNPIYQSAFVTDQFSGDGTTTAFTMSVAPAGTSNVLVVVSGVVQDPSTYGVVGNTLNFSAAPPSGTGNISCRYLGVPVTGVTTTAYRTVTEFTATAGQTTFTPASYNVGFINVYRNGVLLGSADYTATNGTTVVLATGATAGDLVTVESFLISSVSNAISNTAGSVSTSNIINGGVTAAKMAASSVVLTSSAISGVLPEANGGTGTTTGYYGFKNRIINGAMMIDQRNAGASVTVTTSTGYTLDRWQIAVSQSSKLTCQQNAGSVTPPNGFSNYLGITSSSAYSVNSGDYFLINQFIEGLNTADLNWGTANAAAVTLSFWVRSSLTGTFAGCLDNDGNARSYPFSYTINSANTWEQKSITIAGDTSGTWLKTNGKGIGVRFSLGVGSTYTTTAGAWASGAYFNATGATNLVSTNGATFYITGVQLEKGSTATSFDYRPYGTELALCQRYAVMYKPNVTDSSIAIGSWRSSTATFNYLPYPVEMRTTPSLSVSAASDWGSSTEGFHGGAVIASTSITIATESNNKSAYIAANNAGTGTAYRPNGLQSMNTSASLLLSAEL